MLLATFVPGNPARAASPSPSSADVRQEVARFLTRWRIHDYSGMHALVAAADRQRYTASGFGALHAALAEAVGLTAMDAAIGSPRAAVRRPEPRPPDLPAPPLAPEPVASGETPTPPLDPNAIVLGPVPAIEVPVTITLHTSLFGDVTLERVVSLTEGATGWAIRWSPELLFPELGPTGGTFVTEAGPLPTRGRILAADGTVLAESRADGVRVYPQDTLAGQTVGYATPLTAVEATARPLIDGYREGEVAGRRGVEAGAEGLLRGRPGLVLLAQPFGGMAEPVLDRPEIAGADVVLTIQTDLQRSAEAALAGYPEAATAVVDPRTGDVWALASAPSFNPNAMTTGTTFGGTPISAASNAQMVNHAVEVAYPTGSSFKPFTLAAALLTGVAGPATRMPCAPTWDLQGFTFVNFELHQLPGLVDLRQAMAFSCNTTYMPLSMMVYEYDHSALTQLIADFGFGRPTGIGWVNETGGVLPDAFYFESHPRGSGEYVQFNPFDQVQLAIGQGSFLGTQLQLAMAYAAFANRGTLWKPRLVTSATTPDGDVRLATQPEVQTRIPMDADDLEYLVSALQAVTTYSYGTGTAAFAGFGIPVAGKSGTAESGGPDPHALFPAFAPTNAPEIVVATLLARVHLGTGGSDSAPLVRRVMATYFNR